MQRKHFILIAALILISGLIYYVSFASQASDNSNTSYQNDVESVYSSNIQAVTKGARIELDSIPGFKLGATLQFKNLEVLAILGTYENLRNYVVLEQAMKEGLVKLKETSSVSELSIDNTSDQYIYLQSGDIVKGGKQDRTLQMDIVLAPKEKNVPVASFCVESGRWGQRENETAHYFEAAEKSLSSKDLKLSNRKLRSQSEVWDKVSVQKNKLNRNLSYSFGDDVSVDSSASPTSLQLTLENEKVNQLIKEYKTHYKDMNLEGAVGFAYAINGEIYGAEIYNNKMFVELQEKILDAFITEAIADADTASREYNKVTEEDWMQFISPISNITKTHYQKLNNETGFLAEEGDAIARFTSYDIGVQKWIHISILDDPEQETELKNGTPSSPTIIRNEFGRY
jgi:hypothetical protein